MMLKIPKFYGEIYIYIYMNNKLDASEFNNFLLFVLKLRFQEELVQVQVFFAFNLDEEKGLHIPAIVTSKHVVKNSITGKLRFSLKDEKGAPLYGQYHDVILKNFESLWIMHPDNDVDLCILPIANIHHEVEDLKMSFFKLIETVICSSVIHFSL